MTIIDADKGNTLSLETLRRFKQAMEWEGEATCVCGILAGCCDAYPNCAGNPDWKPDTITPSIEILSDGHVTNQHCKHGTPSELCSECSSLR